MEVNMSLCSKSSEILKNSPRSISPSRASVKHDGRPSPSEKKKKEKRKDSTREACLPGDTS